MNVVWTEEEKEFIRKNAGKMTDAKISEELTKSTGRNVSLQAARKQRQKLKMAKCRGRGVCMLVDKTASANPKPRGVGLSINGGDGD